MKLSQFHLYLIDQLRSLIGIDLGGTKIASARFDAQTLETQESTLDITRADLTFDFVREQILQCIGALRDAGTVAVGIGVPGPVERVSRRIVRLPNIPGAEGFDLAEFVQQRTGLPTIIENDANCFTFAEATLGIGRGEPVVAGIVMGTGVGGGIVIDGKIFHGARGFAGEIGHMLLVPGRPPYDTKDKPACPADRRGEVEQFLSGTAMRRRCEQAKTPQDFLSGEVCAFMRPEIFQEVAWLITNLTHAIDPSMIIFGGSAGRALKPHLPAVQQQLQRWLLPGVPAPTLAIGELPDAPLRGAAMLANDL